MRTDIYVSVWRAYLHPGAPQDLHGVTQVYQDGGVPTPGHSEAVKKEHVDPMGMSAERYRKYVCHIPRADGIALLRRAAAAGEAAALVDLGDLYVKGHAVAQDSAVARRFFTAAAGMGYAFGMHKMGIACARSLNYEEAVRWFEQAVAAGRAPFF